MTGRETHPSRNCASLPENSTPAPGAKNCDPSGGFNPRVEIPREAVAAFCGKWGIAELSLFGSALRGDFRPESDVDLLVRFAPGKRYGLLAFARMQGELEAIFGRKVDLVAEKAVERSENRIKRRHILGDKGGHPCADDGVLLDIVIAARRARQYLSG